MASKDEKRKAAADRARRYREKRVAKEDPEAAARMATEKRQKEEEEERALKQSEENAKALEVELQAQLTQALAGTAEMLSTLAVPKGAPTLGPERAEALGKLWAPLLAPYFSRIGGEWMPWLMAATGTAYVAASWRADIEEWKSKQKVNDEAQSA